MHRVWCNLKVGKLVRPHWLRVDDRLDTFRARCWHHICYLQINNFYLKIKATFSPMGYIDLWITYTVRLLWIGEFLCMSDEFQSINQLRDYPIDTDIIIYVSMEWPCMIKCAITLINCRLYAHLFVVMLKRNPLLSVIGLDGELLFWNSATSYFEACLKLN